MECKLPPGSRILQEDIKPFAFLHILRFYFKVCSDDYDCKLNFYKVDCLILFNILILFFYGLELFLNMAKDNSNLPGFFGEFHCVFRSPYPFQFCSELFK